ncbi:MAG: peptidyl-prolyl cis-trans isomerase B (cyclophilin B) [Planctomycetota bacterium]|jgi:peptidyl-prolyl cis-trans isomerase B (cyclophilin B)
MTTKTPATNDLKKADLPWWERLTDTSSDADAGKRILKLITITAVVVLVGVAAWNFVDSSKAQSEDERAQILEKGLFLLPDREDVNYGTIVDQIPTRSGRGQTIASAFVRSSPGLVGRDSVTSIAMEPEAAAIYKEEVEQAIQELTDRKSLFEEGHWEARYLHTLQQLHFFAAVNSTDNKDRLDHLGAQIAILDDLKARYSDHGLLGMKPLPSQPEKTVLDCYYDAAKAEHKFHSTHNANGILEADKNLKVTIELDNGKILEIETYSRVAPKALKNFIDHAQAGRYDGTAFHAVNAEDGTFVGGGAYSRDHADRKFIWGQENPGYTLTMETTSLLPSNAGTISLHRESTTGHGLFFKIHTVDADVSRSVDTVFAKVTSGLDALSEWISTEVHDEAGLNNTLLPRVRLGIKKVTVTGEMDYPSEDSWKPAMLEMKPGAVTAAEKAFIAKLKALEDGGDKDKPEDDK